MRVQNEMSAVDILKALEKNSAKLDKYQKQNASMFKRIDNMFKKFFKKVL
ncbi:hypothetical protein HWC53_gp063 [Bacillus phage vB_BmeM-Goe8]|uniref:Uncharacterized protein n=1 Tax=Bacillus phage vB_BmeM-Goe8 TaxID=2593638 RepID=A0A516KN61_9CAUD|nr:hypothetical protein HWC53_gp015 [Bacillus phage vB_BmeM-Goe8]YP_009850187.1 hypothetical protein HWC53_gp063 [Bacillus phage vB_BmeM-Goe8]QDP42799.1 hypothetical protein Goe8_c00150 [Bacillus phage vB_BmeM-Goe8]QDP43026.1 hypothetical protein Goe8_c02530 [Bacillus phage vB_BmeM-Goe8]